MKLIITLLITLTIVSSQRITCDVCFNIAKCPQALFSDKYVDALYKSLPKSVQEPNYPQELTRQVNQRSAIYTFIWPTQIYRAEVDLVSNKFSITVQSRANSLPNAQDQFGLRPQRVKTAVQTSDTTSQILTQIDVGIRAKYFLGQTVTCTEVRSTPKGYLFFYKKSDKSIYSFDVTVENKNGNILVNFKPIPKEQAETVNTAVNGGSVGNQFPQPTTTQQFTAQQPTTAGGYEIIRQPLKDSGVKNIISYFYQRVEVLKFTSLIQAQRQIVAGTNYRFTLTFDTSSPAYYVVIVNQNFAKKYTVLSSKLVNIPSSYKFTTPLTATQVIQITYLTPLSNRIAQQLPTLLNSDSILDQIYIYFPFYQFVYHNSAYSKIVVVVSYDILANKLIIISKDAVPVKAAKARISETEPAKPQNSNNLQSQVQMSQDLQKLCQQVLISEPIQNYIILQSSKDACYSLDNLLGVYWNDKEKTTLCFRYKSAKDVIVSIEYIQFVFRQTIATGKDIQIDNCLQQKGQACIQCVFKYYLNGGKCFPVAPECRDFNYKKNQCNQCYNGFYLDLKNVCQPANFLCETTNRQGNCATCYKDFTLTKTGLCVFNAQGDFRLSDQQSNPICSKFIGGKCVACIKGSYLNTKSICRVPDQNCQDFDEVKEQCNVCMNKYELSPASKKCVPSKKY